MAEWERIELRPLFTKLIESANTWEPPKVLTRTQKLGELVLPQLKSYTDGKFRVDRNESVGFFEAIDKFVKTGLPISLEHFTDLVNQYKDRVTPYPHYSGIKLTLPKNFDEIDNISPEDIPKDIPDDDEEDKDSSLTLM